MIKKSRFKDYFKTLDENESKLVLENISLLVEENKEYADNNNYEHLCNLFSSLALVKTKVSLGLSKVESEKLVFDAMYAYLEPQVGKMQKLAKHKWFVPMLKKLMPIKFKHTLGHGWNVEFPEAPKTKFCMITHACIYHQIFTKYGYPEMTCGFCKVDDMLYSALPHTKFSYYERLGEGGSFCDYSYERID